MAASSDDGRRLPEGVLVGHWTDPVGRTGCTVILAPAGAVGGVDVRGAAPSTLCTDTLRPGTLVERAHAILLTGGSAFGLDSRPGRRDALPRGALNRLRSSPRSGCRLWPARCSSISPNGDPNARPNREAGYAACGAVDRRPGGRSGRRRHRRDRREGRGPRPRSAPAASGSRPCAPISRR